MRLMARTPAKRARAMARVAEMTRKTKETSVRLQLGLDGKGRGSISTGLPFLDHMLESLARHSGFDLSVKASGDLQVDDHHLVEDVGLVLGSALDQALAARKLISRYGWAVVPMDEALVMCAVDLGGRAHLSYQLELSKRIKEFNTELVQEFLEALVRNAKMNLHLRQLAGRNSHHIIEAAFKALAQALGAAAAPSTRYLGVPSTKGVL